LDNIRYSDLDLKMALLRVFGSGQKAKHKANVLGGRGGRGELERQLDTDFADEERAIAHRSMESLERDGLIQPTYKDVINPLDWLTLTETGKRALEREAVDDLDFLLISLDRGLLKSRHGAWSAVYSENPDTVRQAAHSARELLRLVLKRLAPDDEVRRTKSFEDKTEIRRRDRVTFIMKSRVGRVSKSTRRVIEAQCNLVEKLYDRLSAVAHDPDPSALRDQVKRLIRAVEDALLEVLGSAA